MKNIYKNPGFILVLIAILLANACKDNITPIVDELSFERAFTPVELIAVISNVTTVTLSWPAEKNVDHYAVELYQGTEFIETALVTTAEVAGDITTYAYILPAGDTQFSARLKAVSSLEGVSDSKWISVGFKSAPENLFLGYTSEMTGLNECTVRWTPGTVATALMFVKGIIETPYTLSAGEIASGVKILTGIANGSYEVKLMNSTFVRGKTKVFLEGTVMLTAGADLLAAISAASPGDVILLPQGGGFVFTANTTITKSIKIRAIFKNNMPTLYPATGASTTAPLFLIGATLTPSDSIVFQNVILTGYINNIAASGMVTGVYDQGTTNACNIGLLKFDGCVLSHFSRHLIRLRGTATQVINRFEVNSCILFDYGTNSTSYGVISSNTATATINSLKFSNSTIYNFLSYLILYSNATACNSVILENCSLNQITYTTGSTGRFIMDLNNTLFTTGGISVSNCIFGSTAAGFTNGIRNTSGTLTFTNSYFTSDFIDNTSANPTFTIMGRMTAYPGASTALWVNPLNGDFHILDAGFAGKSTTGDPRWRP